LARILRAFDATKPLNAKSSGEGNGGLAPFRIGTSGDRYATSGSARREPRPAVRAIAPPAQGISIMLAPIVAGSIVSVVVLVTGTTTAFAFQTGEQRTGQPIRRRRGGPQDLARQAKRRPVT
jgi:hypothetical protein